MPKERILVVEDHPATLKLVRLLLEHEGYEVAVAMSARETLEVLAGFAAQLILLDLQLPDEHGLDLAVGLRRDPRFRQIPIVAVTASTMRHEEQRAAAAGCDGFVSKPIDTRSFPLLVRGFLDRAAGAGGLTA